MQRRLGVVALRKFSHFLPLFLHLNKNYNISILLNYFGYAEETCSELLSSFVCSDSALSPASLDYTELIIWGGSDLHQRSVCVAGSETVLHQSDGSASWYVAAPVMQFIHLPDCYLPAD